MEAIRSFQFRYLHVSFLLLLVALLIPGLATAQINFQKSRYYIAMGDSLSAGEGAMPVTQGSVYRLYDQGVFGPKKEMDFSNISIRAARTWEVLSYQVPQAICLTDFQPGVVTITVGANDFFRGDFDIFEIAKRSADIVNRLLNGASYFDAQINAIRPCLGLPNVTVLIANNYTVPVPDPALNAQLDFAARSYFQALQFLLSTVPVPPGSRVGIVDLYGAFKDRNGLLLVQKKNGLGPGPFDFEVHPTNAGHAAIALAFQRAWATLPPQP